MVGDLVGGWAKERVVACDVLRGFGTTWMNPSRTDRTSGVTRVDSVSRKFFLDSEEYKIGEGRGEKGLGISLRLKLT